MGMKQDNPWWYVDLEKSASVTKVIVYNRSDCCGERLRNFEVRVGDVKPDGTKYSANQKCGTLHWGDAPEKGGGQLTVGCENHTGRYVVIVVPGKNRLLTLCEVKVVGTFTTAAYSKCKTALAGIEAQLKLSKDQYNKMKKELAKVDNSKLQEELKKVQGEEKKAKSEAKGALGNGNKQLEDQKLKQAKEREGLNAQAEDAKGQLAKEKEATKDMAQQKEAAEGKAANTATECTKKMEENAAEMAALKKGQSQGEQKCVEKAKAEKALKNATEKAKNMQKSQGSENAKHEATLSELKKTCKTKEQDAREEGRKAGLQACPGVNGLMREIWRLRQKAGEKAAGEEEY